MALANWVKIASSAELVSADDGALSPWEGMGVPDRDTGEPAL